MPPENIVDMEAVRAVFLPPFEGNTVLFYRSFEAGVGSVQFDFDLDLGEGCTQELSVWGLVWDDAPMISSNADSFWVGIDEDPMIGQQEWRYGCPTSRGESWAWKALYVAVGERCSVEQAQPIFSHGSHSLSLLNVDDGFSAPGAGIYDFAGVVAIAISDDPSFDPNTILEPSQ